MVKEEKLLKEFDFVLFSELLGKNTTFDSQMYFKTLASISLLFVYRTGSFNLALFNATSPTWTPSRVHLCRFSDTQLFHFSGQSDPSLKFLLYESITFTGFLRVTGVGAREKSKFVRFCCQVETETPTVGYLLRDFCLYAPKCDL